MKASRRRGTRARSRTRIDGAGAGPRARTRTRTTAAVAPTPTPTAARPRVRRVRRPRRRAPGRPSRRGRDAAAPARGPTAFLLVFRVGEFGLPLGFVGGEDGGGGSFLWHLFCPDGRALCERGPEFGVLEDLGARRPDFVLSLVGAVGGVVPESETLLTAGGGRCLARGAAVARAAAGCCA